jgi:glucose uptake protein GlcU
MKYAPPNAAGATYVISFSIGATIVTAVLWCGRYIYLCQRCGSFSTAYELLPSFHFRQMWLAGGLCGLLWSIGNFFSILSVKYLGEGVGYSIVQLNLLVSGVWGIVYFGEVQGTATIAKWFGSAVIAVVGILLLSYEHHVK